MPILPKLFAMILFVGILSPAAFGQHLNIWRGITPLKSTREDVEKILGKPEASSVGKHAAGYRIAEGSVSIVYSTGLCSVNSLHGWDVAELTVISIYYKPDYSHSQKLANLRLDPKKFEKRADPGSINLVDYTNAVYGLGYTIDSTDDSVWSISYFPESKYRNLLCAKKS